MSGATVKDLKINRHSQICKHQGKMPLRYVNDTFNVIMEQALGFEKLEQG